MSLRRRGVWLLVVAFALRVLARQVSSVLVQPYQGMVGAGQVVDEWLDFAIPLVMDILALAAVVAGAVRLAGPALLREVEIRSGSDREAVDAGLVSSP